MEEKSWRRNQEKDIMEEEPWRRNHGGGLREEESRRTQGGGIREEESKRRSPGREILEEEPCGEASKGESRSLGCLGSSWGLGGSFSIVKIVKVPRATVSRRRDDSKCHQVHSLRIKVEGRIGGEFRPHPPNP